MSRWHRATDVREKGLNLRPLGYKKANGSNNNDLHAVTGKQKSKKEMVRKGREVLVWG
jgi:hypothetical protein